MLQSPFTPPNLVLDIKKIILHAGTHKTGSTAIQNYLATHPMQGEADYLYHKDANSSLLMAQAFKANIATDPEFLHAGYSDEDVIQMRHSARECLAEMARNAKAPLCILSAETMSTFTEEELLDTQKFMASLFEVIDVFIYVRPLKERMESGFQEILKTRYQSLNEKIPLNYMGLSRKFDSAFGRDRVHFFRFARDNFPGGSVIAHFLQSAGVSQEVKEKRPANSRLSKEAVQLLYAYRMYFPEAQRGERTILRKLERLGKTPFHFHSSLYQKLLHTGKHASRRFAERAGFSVDENIASHDNIGIRDEGDMLDFPPESIKWLHGELSIRGKLKFRKSSSPESVAQALDSLRSLI